MIIGKELKKKLLFEEVSKRLDDILLKIYLFISFIQDEHIYLFLNI